MGAGIEVNGLKKAICKLKRVVEHGRAIQLYRYVNHAKACVASRKHHEVFGRIVNRVI